MKFRLNTNQYHLDPYPLYEELRAEGPIHWADDIGRWVIVDHHPALSVLKDVQTYSSERGQGSIPEALRATMGPFLAEVSPWMVFRDPPAHTLLRRRFRERFLRVAVRSHLLRIKGIVHEATKVTGDGTFDFVHQVAAVIPATVFSELILGLSQVYRPRMLTWAHELSQVVGTPTDASVVTDGIRAITELKAFFREQVEERRKNPGDDLLTDLAQDVVFLSNEDLAQLVMLVFGGHETIMNLICNTILALSEHAEVWQTLQKDPERSAEVVEEMLRYDSPIQAVNRYVTRSLDLCGQVIEAGQTVAVLVGSANRDPKAYDAPNELVLGRAGPPHIAFGFGTHYCLGAELARAEASATIQALIRRGLPKVQSVTWRMDSISLRGPSTLQVTW